MWNAHGVGRMYTSSSRSIKISSSRSPRWRLRGSPPDGDFRPHMAASTARAPDTLRRTDQPNLAKSVAIRHDKTWIIPGKAGSGATPRATRWPAAPRLRRGDPGRTRGQEPPMSVLSALTDALASATVEVIDLTAPLS